MAAVHGKGAGILIAQYNLTSYFKSLSTSNDVDTAEVTCFGDDDKEFIPGMRDGTVSVEGVFDSAASGVDVVLASMLGAAAGSAITSSVEGFTAGNNVDIATVRSSSYEVSAEIGDAVMVSGEFQCDGGLHHGKILSSHASVSSSATGAAHRINVSASSVTSQLVTALHVTAISSASVDVKIQHSADGSSGWADVTGATFAQATTVTSQVLTTADITLYPFVRYVLTFAGTSATFAVSAAHKPV